MTRLKIAMIRHAPIGLIGQNGLNVPHHVEEDSGTLNVCDAVIFPSLDATVLVKDS